MKEKVKYTIATIIDNIDVILFIGIILWVIVYCVRDSSEDKEDRYATSLLTVSSEEKNVDLEDENRELEIHIENLQSEIYGLEEDLGSKEGELEELQREYDDALDLINLLQGQLEEYGIEPYEL